MADTKEARLAELLKQPPQKPRTELPGDEQHGLETRDLGEAVAHRKCSTVRCSQFANEHPILVRGEETVRRYKDGKGNFSDHTENSWSHWNAVDPNDAICPECKRNVGFTPPGARNILNETANPSFGVSNDREAVIQAYKRKDLPLPKWAVQQANEEVRKAVKE